MADIMKSWMDIIEENIKNIIGNCSMLYTYPDGTKSVVKPKQGQTYCYYTPMNTVQDWIWDDVAQTWIKFKETSVGTPQFFIDFSEMEEGPDKLREPTKCECGSEKTGSNRHSTWCQKYNPGV